MASVQAVRAFIMERLNAAAEEIFTVFESTIVRYEQELACQNRLLESVCQSEVRIQRVGMDTTGQSEGRIHRVGMDTTGQSEGRIQRVGMDTTGQSEGRIHRVGMKTSSQSEVRVHRVGMETSCQPEVRIQRVGPPQEQDYEEAAVADQETNTSLDQEEPEPIQIKEEPEEVEQVILQEEDICMVMPPYEESDHSEAEPTDGQPSSHCTLVTESYDQEGSYAGDSSAGSAEQQSKKRNLRNKSPSSYTDNSPNEHVDDPQGDADTGKKPAKCDVCGKTFQHHSKLKRHYRTHTGEKPYSCKTCGKRFAQSGHLVLHRRTHTGERPYSCTTCGKSFCTSSDVIVHMRTHTGERPYTCTFCGKGFSTSSAATVHMRVHTGERLYPCEICWRSFSTSSSLTVHMRTHQPRSHSPETSEGNMI